MNQLIWRCFPTEPSLKMSEHQKRRGTDINSHFILSVMYFIILEDLPETTMIEEGFRLSGSLRLAFDPKREEGRLKLK